MKSIAFFNNKGGVGKTTLLCNVAAYFATEMKKKVLVIDADPQCNATQYMFKDNELDYLYQETSSFTIYSVIRPLAQGRGYSKDVKIRKSKTFNVDVIPGDPRLALTEDLLARDWGTATAGDTRGIRTSLLFVELLERYDHYDLVFFDVGPSLGSINRAVLLGCDYFVSPMSTDIFSLKAIENIANWFGDWTKKWKSGLKNSDAEEGDIPVKIPRLVTFAGYVTQQYLAKADSSGARRPVKAYDRIFSQVDNIVKEKFSKNVQLISDNVDYKLGTIPNLFSLIPMSQSSRKPIFGLASVDGVRGAHFAKVKDAEQTFAAVAGKLTNNIKA